MKISFQLLFFSVLFSAYFAFTGCSENKSEFGIYGDSTMTTEGAVSAGKIPELLEGKDSVHVKAEGVIHAVCQKKGCWMQIGLNENDMMTVRFKNYDFFVPMNASGHNAIFEGFAFIDTTTVATLRHLAEEAEKSEEEINAITEPEVSYNFVATGVIIQ